MNFKVPEWIKRKLLTWYGLIPRGHTWELIKATDAREMCKRVDQSVCNGWERNEIKGMKDLCMDRESLKYVWHCRHIQKRCVKYNDDDDDDDDESDDDDNDKLVENEGHHTSLIKKLYNTDMIE